MIIIICAQHSQTIGRRIHKDDAEDEDDSDGVIRCRLATFETWYSIILLRVIIISFGWQWQMAHRENSTNIQSILSHTVYLYHIRGNGLMNE